jgi:hypothetical protein
MSSQNDERIEQTLAVLHATEKAILVSEDPAVWLPLSQLDVIKKQGVMWTISMPLWLAKKYDLD